MRLEEYKATYNLSYEKLEKQLGISASKLLRLCQGDLHCLRPFEINLILKNTEGQVTLCDLGVDAC